MISNLTSTTPSIHNDGTISAVVQEARVLPTAGTLLRLWLPLAYDAGGGIGQFLLARCTDDNAEARANDWSIYTRRALFCTALPTAMPDQAGSTWELLIPGGDDPGHQWLRRREVDTSINLLGPFGQPFELAANTRALLVLANHTTLPLVLPILHNMLDRGGRVTLFIKGDDDAIAPLLPLIPIPVEIRVIPALDWLTHLAEPVRWADQLCAALPNQDYATLAHHIRTLRFQLDADFAHVLVASDLICGVGACLTCVIATRDGSFTRTCIHGPLLPLATIA